MSSTRLPGKVLADVAGEPMIFRQLARIERSRSLENLVVVTSDHPSDDVLADTLRDGGVATYRGPLHDVLQRYIGAAEWIGADTVVRLTADCPLLDPFVIDRVVDSHRESAADYTSNVLERTFPRGLDAESVTVDALRRVSEVASKDEREHVTSGIYGRPHCFTLESVTQETNFSHLRWTVDTPEDLDFVRTVYQEIGGDGLFGAAQLYELLESRPDLRHEEPV